MGNLEYGLLFMMIFFMFLTTLLFVKKKFKMAMFVSFIIGFIFAIFALSVYSLNYYETPKQRQLKKQIQRQQKKLLLVENIIWKQE